MIQRHLQEQLKQHSRPTLIALAKQLGEPTHGPTEILIHNICKHDEVTVLRELSQILKEASQDPWYLTPRFVFTSFSVLLGLIVLGVIGFINFYPHQVPPWNPKIEKEVTTFSSQDTYNVLVVARRGKQEQGQELAYQLRKRATQHKLELSLLFSNEPVAIAQDARALGRERDANLVIWQDSEACEQPGEICLRYVRINNDIPLENTNHAKHVQGDLNFITLWTLGQAAYSTNNYRKVLELWGSIKEQSQDDLDNRLGVAYYNLGYYRKAIQSFNTAADRLPLDATIYNNRGNAYDELGQHQRALEDYAKSISLDSEAPLTYNNRGATYNNMGKYDLAIKDLNKALELKPDYGRAYYNRGNAYHELDEHQAAIDDFDRAIEYKPCYAWAYTNRGIVKADLGKYFEAIEDYNQALACSPNLFYAYNSRGNAYSNLDKPNAAIEDYTKAIRIKSDYIYAYHNRGLVYTTTGQYDKAIADFQSVLKYRPDYGRSYSGLGEVYTKLGRWEEAIAHLEKAQQLGFNTDTVQATLKKAKAGKRIGSR